MSDQEIAVEAMESADSDAPVGSEEASVGSEPTNPVGTESQEEPFFTWEGKDGSKRVFKNAGELATHLNHSSMFREDFERERDSLRKQGETFSERMKQLQAKESSLNERFAKISKLDQFLKNTPGLERDLEQLVSRYKKGSANPDLYKEMLDQELTPIKQKLEEREKAEAEKQESERRARALEDAAKEVGEGFKRDDALRYMQKIQNAPEQEQLKMLYIMLHHAAVVEQTPAQVEQKLANQRAKTRPPSVTSTPGRVSKGGADPAKMTRNESRDEALRILESMG